MSEVSIQIRRVTEKVKRYYSMFGLRPYAQMSPGRAVIRGAKRLGFDEIECVVAETSRGTSVGFYSINKFQGLLHTIPLVLVLLLTGLSNVDQFSSMILGKNEDFATINFVKLFAGDASFEYKFVISILLIALFFVFTDYVIQKIRLENIKSRFSFFTKDAIWHTREIPLPILLLVGTRSIFMQNWLLAILYFGVFSSPGDVVTQLGQLYNTNQENLLIATIDAFTITAGLIVGLLSAYKALEMRKYLSRFDDRLKISGSLTERRIDPIFFSIQSAFVNSVVILLFMSSTFLLTATGIQIMQFLFFSIIGGVIGGLIHEEGILWNMSAYAIFLFFSSLVFIFQTGTQSAYAYVVVLQLFFVPIPFLMILSMKFEEVLKKSGIRTKEWLFDIIPITSYITLILNYRKSKAIQKAYEKTMRQEMPTQVLDTQIHITKALLQDTNNFAYKIVKHYFELIFTYTASFDEDQYVILPTPDQLGIWWSERSRKSFTEKQKEFLLVADQLLWDPIYEPKDQELASYEPIGKEMVLQMR